MIVSVEGEKDINGLFFIINDRLRRVDEIISEAINLSSSDTIREIARHVVFGGGKRFRPALSILAAEICGSKGGKVTHLGAAIELLHSASLIHDDVLDSAATRRGMESANSRWGNHLSVLTGDYLFSIASRILTENFDNRINLALTDAVVKTTEGEALEVLHGSDLSITEAEYLRIIELKTAHLIAGACVSGAMVAGAPSRFVDALRRYGMAIGIAFQITDDVLDYFAGNGASGKAAGIDFREGKPTLPVIYVLKACGHEERAMIIESFLSSMRDGARFKNIVATLNKYDCLANAKKVAKDYVNAAIAELDIFKPSIEKDALVKFAQFIIRRNY